MRPNKEACAPVYYKPETIKDLALTKLDELQNHQSSVPWIGNSPIFLTEDGSFSDFWIEEGSFRVSTQKVFLPITRFFSSRTNKPLKEEQTLRNARRRLLVSLLAHAWLWGRPEVLDAEGEPVAFKERRVLAPQDILDFLGKVRAGKASCTNEEVKHLLQQGIQKISLQEDKSKWNMAGIIACIRWDKSHDAPDEGPWCSCRLKRKGLPPHYDEVFGAKETLQSSVSPLDPDAGFPVTAHKGNERCKM